MDEPRRNAWVAIAIENLLVTAEHAENYRRRGDVQTSGETWAQVANRTIDEMVEAGNLDRDSGIPDHGARDHPHSAFLAIAQSKNRLVSSAGSRPGRRASAGPQADLVQRRRRRELVEVERLDPTGDESC